MKKKKLAFAIPSLGRVNVITSQALQTLKQLGVSNSMIHVFVVEEEEKLYKDAVPKGVNVVVGVRGIGPQRCFINDYFDENTRIVVLDDDVQLIVKSDNKIKPMEENLVELATRAFDLCDEVGARFWTVTNTNNGFFMKHQTVFGLRSAYGAFYGEYSKEPDMQSLAQPIEDCEKGLKHYLKNGGFVRLDDVGVKQKRHAKGGIVQDLGGIDKRIQVALKAAEYVISTYPDLASPSRHEDPEKGLIKLKLKTVSRHPSLLKTDLPETI